MRAAARAQGQPFAYPGLWLVAALLNTLYSFYWDVEHDWDMPWLLAMWRAARAGKAGAAGGRGQQGQQQGQGQSSQDGSAAGERFATSFVAFRRGRVVRECEEWVRGA